MNSNEPLDKKRDWRVLTQGAFGIELSLWCGFGYGRNLFHVYVHIGVATLYLTSRRLDLMVGLYRDILGKAKGRG